MRAQSSLSSKLKNKRIIPASAILHEKKFQNMGQYNAFVNNQQYCHCWLFQQGYFNNHDQQQRTTYNQATMVVSLYLPIKIKKK